MAYINTDTLEYPLTEQQVIAQAFPPNTTPARPFVAPEPFAWVFPTPQPEFDPITQGVRTTEPTLTVKGIWELPWEVYELDPDQAADNLAHAVAQAREAAHRRINTAYTALTETLAADYPENEQKSWPIQVQEASIVLAGGVGDTPWIDAAATARGVTRLYLANLIQAQDMAYRQYHGTLTGTRQMLRDMIDSVPAGPEAVATLNGINWPE